MTEIIISSLIKVAFIGWFAWVFSETAKDIQKQLKSNQNDNY